MIAVIVWTKRIFKASDRALQKEDKFYYGYLLKMAYLMVTRSSAYCCNLAEEADKNAGYYTRRN